MGKRGSRLIKFERGVKVENKGKDVLWEVRRNSIELLVLADVQAGEINPYIFDSTD